MKVLQMDIRLSYLPRPVNLMNIFVLLMGLGDINSINRRIRIKLYLSILLLLYFILLISDIYLPNILWFWEGVMLGNAREDRDRDKKQKR